MVASVSGNTIHLRLRNGAAAVDFSPSTVVTELSSAQRADVTVGSCVAVEPTPDSPRSGDEVTARSVTISPPVDGKCTPLPAAASTASPPTSAAPAANPTVRGMVASVSGNTFTINNVGGNTSQTNVTVTSTTTYVKQTSSNTQAVTQGKCMAAQGPDRDGVLQATTIELQACPPLGRPRFRFPFPHLPHHHH